jgi:hypothetical protein
MYPHCVALASSPFNNSRDELEHKNSFNEFLMASAAAAASCVSLFIHVMNDV